MTEIYKKVIGSSACISELETHFDKQKLQNYFFTTTLLYFALITMVLLLSLFMVLLEALSLLYKDFVPL